VLDAARCHREATYQWDCPVNHGAGTSGATGAWASQAQQRLQRVSISSTWSAAPFVRIHQISILSRSSPRPQPWHRTSQVLKPNRLPPQRPLDGSGCAQHGKQGRDILGWASFMAELGFALVVRSYCVCRFSLSLTFLSCLLWRLFVGWRSLLLSLRWLKRVFARGRCACWASCMAADMIQFSLAPLQSYDCGEAGGRVA
jgi:hypothetical protein